MKSHNESKAMTNAEQLANAKANRTEYRSQLVQAVRDGDREQGKFWLKHLVLLNKTIYRLTAMVA